MRIEPYQLDELRFAWCYRVFLRWETHHRRPLPHLANLDREVLESLIDGSPARVLETTASTVDVKVLASLEPRESVAACASRLKGRCSKWLREQSGVEQPERQFKRGYFACTTGGPAIEAVMEYLQSQGDHHGYGTRIRPPDFVVQHALDGDDEVRLQADHSGTLLRFHVVLATSGRKGVFGRDAAEAVADRWSQLGQQGRFAIEKVSFVPDHVHLAVRVHPASSPACIVVDLMNAAQQLMWEDFSHDVIQAALERLWQPSAYIGSFGTLESRKISSYVRRWEESDP